MPAAVGPRARGRRLSSAAPARYAARPPAVAGIQERRPDGRSRCEARTLLQGQEHGDRPRGERQPSQPAAYGRAPAPSGERDRRDEEWREHELREEQSHTWR